MRMGMIMLTASTTMATRTAVLTITTETVRALISRA